MTTNELHEIMIERFNRIDKRFDTLASEFNSSEKEQATLKERVRNWGILAVFLGTLIPSILHYFLRS